MTNKRLALIDELASPLQRIMWIYNVDEPSRRSFENNICTFHIGNGFFLSVAHNLRIQQGFYRSIEEQLFKKEILMKLDGAQKLFLDQCYFSDDYTRKKYLNSTDHSTIEHIAKILKQKRFDTRWVTFAHKKICNPFLVFQFKNNAYFNEPNLNHLFDKNRVMFDADAGKHTYFIEVDLVKAFYGADIALYKTVSETPQQLINKIPVVELSFDLLDEATEKFYCIQSSPNGPAGRLMNEARIEGMLDHFGIFQDDIDGNYQFEGYRYLIKGYFRFGSSGAPYVYYDKNKGKYLANAIQSEASGIQLSIKNDREGNFQYINAIASPLFIIKDELQQAMSNAGHVML